MNRKSITIIIFSVILVAIVVFNKFLPGFVTSSIPLPAQVIKVIQPEDIPAKTNNNYHSFTTTTNDASEEVAKAFGPENVGVILKINRINSEFIKKGDTLVIPYEMNDLMKLSPFPPKVAAIASLPKILFFSQRIQAFGVYEYGELVRWGPVSTGKESTPTPSQLYFSNWKSKQSISTVNPDWLLKWNFNLDNLNGIDMHQYEMPGYPASHSCIRMFAVDAKWMYSWADQWTVSRDGETVLTYGTPVIVFGEYDFDRPEPWKNLPLDGSSTNISKEELEREVSTHMAEIIAKQNF